jgi:hypothetical protein
VVPAEFTGYFTAAAAAAGVLIGLLFVAVSLRSETVFGNGASAAGRAQAGSAFISLSNCRIREFADPVRVNLRRG